MYSLNKKILVRSNENSDAIVAYSNYLSMMNPGPDLIIALPPNSMSLLVQILCGLVVISIVLLGALCLLHQFTKQAHAQAVEMITFRTSLRY